MSALAMAMLLTGAGAVQDQKPPGRLPPPMPMIAPPAPPAPRPPPAPSRIVPPQRMRANPNAYFSMDDYPASALRANEQGTTGFRLVIGPDGRVADCQVTTSSGSAALDQATCRIMRSRARYLPAHDSRGIPATGTDAGRITWRLSPAGIPHSGSPAAAPVIVAPAPPPAPPPPPAGRVQPPQRARANLNSLFSADDYPAMEDGRQEGTVGFRLTIGPNGRVTDCRVTSSSGSSTLDSTTCRILRSRARYTPARDSAGNPASGSDSGRVIWRLPEETETPAARRAGIPVPFTPAVPRAPLQSYVSARDYPAAALRARTVGISSVRLVVGMTGRVIACDVDDRGSAALGAAACRIARARALYAAARSRAGGFVCDVAFEEIEWRLPPHRRAGRGAAAAAAPPPIAQQLAPGICPGRAP